MSDHSTKIGLDFFPQQRKLMRSSAQNSSGVHWCRPRVRFNELLEKVPKVPEKVWKALVQSQVRFNRVSEKVPEKIPGSLGAKPSQVQQGSGEGSGEGSRKPWCKAKSSSTGFGRSFRRRSGKLWCRARSGSTGFGEGSGEGSRKPWCKAKSSSTGFRRRFRRRFQEALVQSQVKFNRVREKFPEKVWEALVQSQVRFNRFPEKVPALGFAARFRKIRKHKTLRLLGIPTKLIGITVPGL